MLILLYETIVCKYICYALRVYSVELENTVSMYLVISRNYMNTKDASRKTYMQMKMRIHCVEIRATDNVTKKKERKNIKKPEQI